MDEVADILFSQSQHGVCFVLPNGQFQKVNKRLCLMLGYSETELLSMDFQSITHPEDLPIDMEFLNRVLDGEIDTYEMKKRYRHGEQHDWWWANLQVNCIRNADGSVNFFVSQIKEISSTDLTMEQWKLMGEFEGALSAGLVVLHWQPIVSLWTYRIVGYEGLARWLHPDRGIIYPGDFIPLLEATQKLHLLCHHVLTLAQSVCFSANVWASVNVSSSTIERDDWEAASAGISKGLHLEVLESEFIKPDVEQSLRQVRSQGVFVVIDDYGAGFSNTELLTRDDAPFDVLKVDRSIIQRLALGNRAYEVCLTIVSLARKFKLETVAEGVETQQQADLVRQLGFDCVQGRLFGWPVPLSGSRSA